MASPYVTKVLGSKFTFLYRWWGVLPISSTPDAEGLPQFSYFQLVPFLVQSIIVLCLNDFLEDTENPFDTAFVFTTESVQFTMGLVNCAVNFIQCKRGLLKNVVRIFHRFDEHAGFDPRQKCWQSFLVKFALVTLFVWVLIDRWIFVEWSGTMFKALAVDYVRYSFVFNNGLICQLVVEIQRRIAFLNKNVAEVVSTDEDEGLMTLNCVQVMPFCRPEEAASEVCRARRLHVLLGDAVHLLNNCFGLQMLTLVSSVLFNAVFDAIFFAFARQQVKLRHRPPTMLRIAWQLGDILELFCLAAVCSWTTAEASKTYAILSSADLSKTPSPVRKQIKNFLIQLELETINFSAAGMFPISVTATLKILAVSVTYFCVSFKN